ncbi:MAG: hypothetical protein Q9220_004959 [cf. Caloplaca sp. 1 TL-2023]
MKVRFSVTGAFGRQQHSNTQLSAPASELLPPDLAKTLPKPPRRQQNSPAVIAKKDNGESKQVAPAPATNEKVSYRVLHGLSDAVASADNYKLEVEPFRKPSAEAEKLQRALHEKFIAKRKKDAIAMQKSNETSSEMQSKPPRTSEKDSQKKSTKTLRSESRAARRKAQEAESAVKPPRSQTKISEKSLPGSSERVSSPSISQQSQKTGKRRKGNADLKTKPSTSIEPSEEDNANKTSRDAPPNLASSDTGIIKQLKTRLLGLTEVLKAKGAAEQSSSSLHPSPSTKASPRRARAVRKEAAKPSRIRKVMRSKPATLKAVQVKAPETRIRKTYTNDSTFVAREVRVRSVPESKSLDVKGRKPMLGPKADIAANVKGITAPSDVKKVNVKDLELTALDMEQPPVPRLSYGLDRVLFNPGVYHLQDPRSRVFNFDPYLQTIMPVTEFDFDALKEYITSSRDVALRSLAQTHNKRYVGSSSSMTGILAHFHFLLSQWRAINTSMLSREFPDRQTFKFTELQRTPSAIFLKWREGSYAIDADKEFAGANVLMLLGKSMEKLLTLRTEDFEKYRKSNPEKVSTEEQMAPESYHYSTMGDFLMRSQLDAHDPRLPGTGMFDLKTRAVVSIRMDATNYEEGAGYQIKSRQGAWESFEREYFDMIRAAFLKYSLQVRMGRMDGIFVAFHNTDRIFGFQYISLSEMDSTLHGQWDTSLGDHEFKLSLSLLNDILNRATKKYPDTSLRLHFETREAQTPFMYVFAEPVTEEQITNIQTANDAKIRQFEQNLYGNDHSSKGTGAEDPGWESIQANVQDAMDEDLRDPNHEEGRHDLEPNLTTLAHEATEPPAPSETSVVVDSSITLSDLAAETEDDMNGRSGDNEHVRAEVSGHAGPETMNVSQTRTDAGPQDTYEDPKVASLVFEDTEATTVPVESEDQQQAAEKKRGMIVVGNVGDVDDTRGKDTERETSTAATYMDDIEATEVSFDKASHQQASQEECGAMMPKELETTEPTESVNSTNEQEQGFGDDFPTGADVPFIERISQSSDVRPNGKEVLAMTLTIRNKVNDAYVLRPDDLRPDDKWSVEYALDEVSNPDRAWSLYQACQMRRKKKLDEVNSRSDNDDDADHYIKMLRDLSRKGAEWRRKQDERDSASPVKVLGQVLRAEEEDAA